MQFAGTIEFQGQKLNVWGSMQQPCFAVNEVAKLLGYTTEAQIFEMLKGRERDEVFQTIIKPLMPVDPFDLGVSMPPLPELMFTEIGLYNTLSRSTKPLARVWRRTILNQLIKARKTKRLTVAEQFEEWDAMADTVYVDPITGILMRSVTVAGGGVEQVPYVK